MTIYSNVFFLSLFLISCIICYQDFKERLVSQWIIFAFGAICIGSVFYFRDFQVFIINTITTVLYVGFLWLMLKLYLFLKYKRWLTILNERFGLADLLVMLAIGTTFNLPGIVLFFCSGFIASLLVFVIYSMFKISEQKQIPLAGILVIYYCLIIVCLHFFDISDLIDCSFINS